MSDLTPTDQKKINRPLTPEILVPRLGDYLVEKGLISLDDLKSALAKQNLLRESNQYPQLGQLLVDMGVIERALLDQAITEQILKLREALQQYNQLLEKRVQERTVALQEALQKLSELGKLKANFVANISHELRTPLTHIKGYLELLVDTMLGPLTDEQKQALEVMRQAASRLGQLIDDLIMFSAAEHEEIRLNLTNINVSDLCHEIAKQYLEKTRKKNIVLHVKCEPNLPMATADREKMGWVIGQLLDNAIKFTPDGGQVALNARKENGVVMVSIMDTGIGIPENRLKEIFEPFHQLDSSSTRKFGGTGLGLALVSKIVKAHGFIIRVRSHESKGSAFEILFKADHQ